MIELQQQAAVPYWFMRVKEVTAAIGVSKSTLYAWAAAGKFPKPVPYPGGGVSAWVSTEVTEWMNSLVTARDARLALAV